MRTSMPRYPITLWNTRLLAIGPPSMPLLVAVLTWVNKGIVFDRVPRTFGSVLVLGLSVLAVSTAIILVGLLAAANLKSLMIGA